MPGSGKEEFIKVAIEHGFDVVRMGDIVREAARARGLELDDSSVGGLANNEREKHGMGIWATRTLPRIGGSRVIIDGIRGIAEINVYREKFRERMFVVSIEASRDVRYERIKARGREDTTPTREQFNDRDEREKSWGVEHAMAKADFRIVNEGSLERFREETSEVLKVVMES